MAVSSFRIMIGANLSLATEIVIPEVMLVGNSAFNWLKYWITDRCIRG